MKDKKKMLKRVTYVTVTLGLFFMVLSLLPNIYVNADGNIVDNTKLVMQSTGSNRVEKNNDGETVNYMQANSLAGTIKVKIKDSDTYLTPEIVNNNDTSSIEYVLPTYTGTPYYITVEATNGTGYSLPNEYIINGTRAGDFSQSSSADIQITANNIFQFGTNFPTEGGGSGEPPMNEDVYPVVATFLDENDANGIDVEPDADGLIILPDGWTSGKVSFKAKACTVEGENKPNDGFYVCDADSEYFEPTTIIGVVGIANETVRGFEGRSYVTVAEEFSNYKKETIHLGGDVNVGMAVLATHDMISVRAEANLELSSGLGSSDLSQAIITEDIPKSLSIFFGNTSIDRLCVSGAEVEGIVAVEGGASTVINPDKSATVTLPALSKETTTRLVISIKKKDNTIITRTVDVRRTAIMLKKDGNALKAGYVMNKYYLYNNQPHDDDVFNAYLQVTLYNGSKVVGYKQIKINDETIVNCLVNGTEYNGMHLPPNAWGMETFSDDAIVILSGTELNGVTGASAFLTNGPIDYSAETLPSIEYGVGAGLAISWEEE